MILIGLAGVLASAQPAAGALVPGAPAGPSDPDGTVTVSGVDAGQPVSGAIAPAGFNPLGGYPAPGSAATGFTPSDQGYAGTIQATGPGGNTALMYCVDLLTPTDPGLSYVAGSWASAGTANTGLVARILQDFFPATDAPATVATAGQKAAAVQAAIWFFTDAFVLNSTDPLYPATSAVVARALAEGPPPEPPAPPLAVTGPTTGTVGAVTGPYTVTSSAPTVSVTATGGQLFTDESAAEPLANGASIPTGSAFFLQVADPAAVQIRAGATVVAPGGTTFLYTPADPGDPHPATAQTLILTRPAIVTSTEATTVRFAAPPVPPSPSASTPDWGPGPGLIPGPSPRPVAQSSGLPLTGARLVREIALTTGIGGVLFGIALLALRLLHRRERPVA
jgi:hypothetical protein